MREPRLNFLRGLVLASIAAVVALPLFTSLYLYPAFTGLLTDSIEQASTRAANHLASMFFVAGQELRPVSLSVDFLQQVTRVRQELGLRQVKLFLPTGEVIYSTRPLDIGQINQKPYFHDLLARGKPYTKLVRKGGISLEGKFQDAAVLETYVPIMHGDRFVGAFEVYYDITAQVQALHRLVLRFSISLVVLVLALLTAVLFSYRQAARNIKGRLDMEAALQESESRYRDLVDNANDLVQSVSPDGRFLYVNRSWRQTLGYSREEVAGLTIFDVIPQDAREHCMAMFKRVISGESVQRLETTFVTKAGRHVVLEGNASCRLVDGVPTATRGIFRDITARKQAEAELAAVHRDLEKRVQERTVALETANRELQEEITERVQAQQARERLIVELQAAGAKIKTLSGLLPICASCKKIREDSGYWQKIDVYIQQHSEAEFTHGLCPDCAKELYPDVFAEIEAEALENKTESND